MPKVEPLTDLDRYLEAAVELRRLLQEANQERGDLRRELRELKAERQRMLDSDEIKQRITEAVKVGIDGLNVAVKNATEDATDRVYARFDQIMLICLGEDPVSVREGKKTVTELVLEFVRTRGLPIRATELVHMMMNASTRATEEIKLKRGLGTLPSGRGYGSLPIILDRRVPDGIVYIVIPAVQEGEKRQVFEIHLDSGKGADAAAKAILQLDQAAEPVVPKAFQKKGRRTSSA